MNIRQAQTSDAQAIADIYNRYILHTAITFEQDPVSLKEMKDRIRIKMANYDWLVLEAESQIIGYAYYGPFRPRSAY